MRRTVLSTFLFVAILGLGCMGLAVPGNTEEHCEDPNDPQYDAGECEPDQITKANIALDYATDLRVCFWAVTSDAQPNWKNHWPRFKAEAIRRGLSPRDCKHKLFFTSERTPLPADTAEFFRKGYAALISGDDATALREWKPLAEQGYVYAQTFLGVMHELGQGVPQDYKTAVKWYRRAAAQGDVSALVSLKELEKKIGKQNPSPTVTAEKTPTPSTGNLKKGLDAVFFEDIRPLTLSQLTLFVGTTSEDARISANPKTGIVEHEYAKWLPLKSSAFFMKPYLRPAIRWAREVVEDWNLIEDLKHA